MFDSLAALMPFRRKGSGLSVPILDGAFKPNNALEQAAVLVDRPGLEDIAIAPDGTLHAACGPAVFRVSDTGELDPVVAFDRAVTALAFLKDGTLAAALGTSVVVGPGTSRQAIIDKADGRPFVAVNALHADADGTVLVSDGSANHPYADWSRDLLEKGSSGRVVRIDAGTGTAATLAAGLGYAFGVFADEQRRVLVSESWRHRIDLATDGRSGPATAALPGYPARMAAASGGGFWLSLFACRTQLVEFVLRENDYRKEMIQTVDPRYWVAPALSSGDDFREPLQSGGVKQMGILKPWAPPRSYGLVVRFGADLLPLYSLHSRAGGHHHGIVAVVERGDDLFVLSKGAGRILRLSLPAIQAGMPEVSP